MPDPVSTINCVGDLSNHFTKAQYFLDPIFESIKGVDGVWKSLIMDGGQFPVNSGFASRVTTLAQQRLGYADLNLWRPMDASLSDCDATCDPPTKFVDPGNAQHQWYRLLEVAYNTTPYCLDQIFSNHLNPQEQIAQIFWDIKMITSDVMDEFDRNNQVGLSAYRWMGYDPTQAQGGSPGLLSQEWRFATDANGNVDTSIIILDPSVTAANIAMISTDMLNLIRNRGIPIGTFSPEGQVTVVTDYQTFNDMPLYDSNRRTDARFRQPAATDPSYAATQSYAGYDLKNDFFALRYYATTDAAYPGTTVLKRVFQWANNTMSEGCWSNVNQAYEDADFQISIPWSDMRPVFVRQNGEIPLSAGSGVNFQATASPWNGTWRWLNEINEITPCNVDRNKGFWRMVLKKAARPIQFGQRGNVILHRRYPTRGITRSCQTLGTLTTGSATCPACPAVDFYPPPLITRFSCGGFNSVGACA